MKHEVLLAFAVLLVSWTAFADGEESLYNKYNVDKHELEYLVDQYAQNVQLYSPDSTSPHNNVTLPCVTCQATVFALNWLWQRNGTEDVMQRLLAALCDLLHLEDVDVCKMMTSNFKKEFLYVFGQIIIEPREICGLLLSDCGHPYNPFYSNWTLPLPGGKPAVANLTLPPSTAPRLRVLHLSDIHYDPAYTVGAEVQCSEPLCCRPGHNASQGVVTAAGEWISFGKCDIPLWTVEAMLQQLSREKFDYILWTGDLAPHDVWNYTRHRHVAMLTNLTRLFKQYFPRTPVFSAVGNHEGVPTDNFAPADAPDEFSHAWLYNTLAKQWRNWLPTQTEKTIKYRASYATKVLPGLRLISINTQYCYTTNFWLYLNATDPDDTLQWLIQQLHDAELAGDAVHLIGHVPPGNNDCLPAWSRNYYRIVNRFESTIRGQFFGHTHYDAFNVFYDGADPTARATNMLYIAPSVTSYQYVVPTYRVYTIDGARPNSTWSVLDHETHALDMQTGTPQWKPLYSAKVAKAYSARVEAAFNMSALFPADWAKLIDDFVTDEQKFDKYLFYYTRANGTACDVSCRRARLCELRAARSHDELHLCRRLLQRHAQASSPLSPLGTYLHRWRHMLHLYV